MCSTFSSKALMPILHMHQVEKGIYLLLTHKRFQLPEKNKCTHDSSKIQLTMNKYL